MGSSFGSQEERSPEVQALGAYISSKLFEKGALDSGGAITRQEWVDAFAKLAGDESQSITRKQWNIFGGENAVFDNIVGQSSLAVLRYKEWEAAFDRLAKGGGTISIEE